MDRNKITDHLGQAGKIIRQLPLDKKTIDLFSEAVTASEEQNIPNMPNIFRIFDKIRQEANKENPLVQAQIEKAGIHLLTAKRLLESGICIYLSEMAIAIGTIGLTMPNMEYRTASYNDLIEKITKEAYDAKSLIEGFGKLNYQFSQIKAECTPEQAGGYNIAEMQKYMDRTALLLQSLL